MAGILPRLRFSCGSLYLWGSPSVAPGRDCVAIGTAVKAARVKSAAVSFVATQPAADAFKFPESVTIAYASGTALGRSASGAAAARAPPRERTTLPRNFSPHSRYLSFSVSASPSCFLTSPCKCLYSCLFSASACPPSVTPSSLLSSRSPLARRNSGSIWTKQAQSMLQHRRRGYVEQRKESWQQPEYRQKLQEQQHKLRHRLHQQGCQQQHPQGRQQQENQHQQNTGGCPFAILAVSPLLFTQWDETSDPKNELIFLVGNTLGYCTEKFFENEYGQSIFACVLGLVYMALLGYEGKVNGAVWRMKHVFGTNMKIVGHSRYSYALPPNPLLSSSQKYPSK